MERQLLTSRTVPPEFERVVPTYYYIPYKYPRPRLSSYLVGGGPIVPRTLPPKRIITEDNPRSMKSERSRIGLTPAAISHVACINNSQARSTVHPNFSSIICSLRSFSLCSHRRLLLLVEAISWVIYIYVHRSKRINKTMLWSFLPRLTTYIDQLPKPYGIIGRRG